MIFSYFFITLPHLEHKHMWSIGHLKILSPEIQKIVMVSNFWVILGSHISGAGGQKNFFAKWCFSDKSNIIPQTEENLRQSVYKSFSFAWFLQTVALRIKLLKIVLILSGDRSLSSLFFSCFWILLHDSTALFEHFPYLFVL